MSSKTHSKLHKDINEGLGALILSGLAATEIWCIAQISIPSALFFMSWIIIALILILEVGEKRK